MKAESNILNARKSSEAKSKGEKVFKRDTLHEERGYPGFGVQEEFKDFEDEEEDFNQQNHEGSQNKAEQNEEEVPMIVDEDLNDYSLVFLEKYHGDENEE